MTTTQSNIKDHDLFTLADNFKIQNLTGNLCLSIGKKEIRANKYTLPLLNEFQSPNTIQQALLKTNHLATSIKDAVHISSHLFALIETGILVPSESKNLQIPENLGGNFSGAEIHIRMLNDTARTLFYQCIIKQSVKPSDIVVEIGTGTGVLTASIAKTACKHVYSIEKNENLARKSEQLFADNNVADKITLITGDSKTISLPTKADVLVSEIIGNDPLAEDLLTTIADAKNRLLNENARILPEKINLYAICCQAPERLLSDFSFTGKLIQHWKQAYGIDFSALIDDHNSETYRKLLPSHKLKNCKYLTQPVLIKEIAMNQITKFSLQAEHTTTCIESGKLNAVILFFEISHGDEKLSTEPKIAARTNHWGNYVWVINKPCKAKPGDQVRLKYEYNDILQKSSINILDS